MSDYRDIPCDEPNRFVDEDFRCELRMNHEGPHRVVLDWTDDHRPVLGPSIPHPLHEQLGRCDLMCKTMQAYVDRIASVTFDSKPILWWLQ